MPAGLVIGVRRQVGTGAEERVPLRRNDGRYVEIGPTRSGLAGVWAQPLSQAMRLFFTGVERCRSSNSVSLLPSVLDVTGEGVDERVDRTVGELGACGGDGQRPYQRWVHLNFAEVGKPVRHADRQDRRR